jgi:regulator of replication initiation timing
MTIIAITSIFGLLGIGAAIGYLVGANDKKTELNYLLADSVLETIKWKRDSEELSNALAAESNKVEELKFIISDKQFDINGYKGRLTRMTDEKAILHMELDILENELDDHFDEDNRRKLHNTVQDQLNRKWRARNSALKRMPHITTKSNQD